MSTYCTNAQVMDRLSNTGLLFLVDDDDDDTYDSSESDHVDDVIEESCAEIDSFLSQKFDLPLSTSNASADWLRMASLNLVVERLFERKGGNIPSGIQIAAQRTRAYLERVREGTLRIPGMTYPEDEESIQERREFGFPLVSNN